MSNKIQPGEYSKGSGTDGIAYKASWVVNANWNADNGGWYLNANSVSNPNRWNDGNQVVSRYSFLSPPLSGGVFANNPFLQPPIMRPTSSISLPSDA